MNMDKRLNNIYPQTVVYRVKSEFDLAKEKTSGGWVVVQAVVLDGVRKEMHRYKMNSEEQADELIEEMAIDLGFEAIE